MTRLKSVMLTLLALSGNAAFGQCDVQEIMEMAEQGMSTSMIKNACQNGVDVPACDVPKVLRLARKKYSESQIYEECDPEPGPNEESNNIGQRDGFTSPQGFSPGTVVRQCGCWGYVQLGTRDQEPSCASGIAEAVACYGYFCPAGGYQWGIRCL